MKLTLTSPAETDDEDEDYLIFGPQCEEFGYSAEGKSQSKHLLFRDVNRKLAQVKDPRWNALSTLRNTQPDGAIHYRQEGAGQNKQNKPTETQKSNICPIL